VSAIATFYARSGFPLTLTPPRPGIYYVSSAVYNALTPAFAVQNGTDQTTLPGQTAQGFAMPSSGSSMQLTPEPIGAPYGTYLGPIEAVWYEPGDVAGSFPVTLGALAGLIEWTPTVTLDTPDPIYVAPGAACYAIALAPNANLITVTGVQSGKIVGQSTAPGSTSTLVQLESGTGDTIFAITSSAPVATTISLSVGAAPLINAAQTTGMQQVLIGKAQSPNIPATEFFINTNPLWRSIWVLLIGNAMVGPPVCQGSSGAFYEASTPPYLIPITGEQLFYRFNILPGAESEVGLSLPTAGVVLAYWGADFADTDVLAYNQSGGGAGMANISIPHNFSYLGTLAAGVSAATDIPGFFVDTPPGFQSYLARLWAKVLGGASVNVTARVNGTAVAGWNPITVTTTAGGLVLPTALAVNDLDYVDIVLSSLTGTPLGLACQVTETQVPV
jgi:hypothetical protein